MSPAPIEFPVEGLSDGVVRLRLLAESDLPAIVGAVQDPEIARWTMIPSPYGDDEARQWQRTAAAGIAAGTDLPTVVVDAHDDRLLGSVGVHGLDPETGRCFAGYWVGAPARGHGVARRALSLLCRYAFEQLGAKRIEVWIEPENSASLHVAEAVGFTREGLLRSFMPVAEHQAPQQRRTSASPFGLRDRRRRDMLMYSLLPGDL